MGIDREGAWHLADPSLDPLRAEGRPVSLLVPDGVLSVGGQTVGFDVVFPVLHGPRGEDGTLQGMLEMSDIPYVGCGVGASAVTMDKDMTKRLVAAAGIPTAPWRTIRRREWDADANAVTEAVAHGLHYPLFVKPVAQGSSIGIARVEDAAQLMSAVSGAFRYDTRVLVEQGIDGREIEVAVLDGPRASLPGEVVLQDGWYTYEAKYADDTSQFITPADLSEADTKTVRSMAEAAFELFDLSGLARIDFFLDRSTRKFFLNEVNTMPGFTSISGFPKMWLATGMTYDELCSGLVEAGIRRHEERSRLAIR